MDIIKRICHTYSELSATLNECGFLDESGDNNHYWHWTPMGGDSTCYWEVRNGGAYINFHKSNNLSENTQMAFRSNLGFHSLTPSGDENDVGIVFIPLANNGCILYLTPLPYNTSIADLTINCKNEMYYDPEDPHADANGYVLDDTQLLYNGMVVYSPAEADGKWRCSWRSMNDEKFYWDVDTGDDLYEYAPNNTQIPQVQIWSDNQTVVIQKVLLQNGGWSENMKVLVLGEMQPPFKVFKIHGKKYIALSDNDTFRCPVFQLPTEAVIANISTSTEEYSPNKTYLIGDYCIYDNVLYRCIRKIATPMPFDDTYWQITTVDQEISSIVLYEDIQANTGD